MRLLAWPLAAAIIAAFSPAIAKDDILPVKPLSAIVDLQTAAGGHICSGFYVGDGLMVTASHCVSDFAPFYKAQFRDGSIAVARIAVIANVEEGFDDFAILRLTTRDNRPINSLSIQCDVPDIGDEIHMAGFPGDEGYTVVWGRVSQPLHAWAVWKRPIFGINISSYGGFSGSAVMNTKDEVVGILVGSEPGNKTLAVAVPMAKVCTMLGI